MTIKYIKFWDIQTVSYALRKIIKNIYRLTSLPPPSVFSFVLRFHSIKSFIIWISYFSKRKKKKLPIELLNTYFNSLIHPLFLFIPFKICKYITSYFGLHQFICLIFQIKTIFVSNFLFIPLNVNGSLALCFFLFFVFLSLF